MLLNLEKAKMPVNPPAPVRPVPPPIQTVGERHAAAAVPRQPSRLWCFLGVHKYEIKTETTWQKTSDGQVYAKGPMYILRCPVCGKMKAERLGSGA